MGQGLQGEVAEGQSTAIVLTVKPTGKKAYLLSYTYDIALVTEGDYHELYDVPVEMLEPRPEEAVTTKYRQGIYWQPWCLPKDAPRLNV